MAKTGFFAANGQLSYLPSHPIYSIGPRGMRAARRWEEWRKVSGVMGECWVFESALLLPERATRRDIVDAFNEAFDAGCKA